MLDLDYAADAPSTKEVLATSDYGEVEWVEADGAILLTLNNKLKRLLQYRSVFIVEYQHILFL